MVCITFCDPCPILILNAAVLSMFLYQPANQSALFHDLDHRTSSHSAEQTLCSFNGAFLQRISMIPRNIDATLQAFVQGPLYETKVHRCLMISFTEVMRITSCHSLRDEKKKYRCDLSHYIVMTKQNLHCS